MNEGQGLAKQTGEQAEIKTHLEHEGSWLHGALGRAVSKGLHRNQSSSPLPSRVDWEASPRLEHLASQNWIQLFYYLPTGKELGEAAQMDGWRDVGVGGCECSGLWEGRTTGVLKEVGPGHCAVCSGKVLDHVRALREKLRAWRSGMLESRGTSPSEPRAVYWCSMPPPSGCHLLSELGTPTPNP